jgi:DNA invertase Pin-like site-specific DNA recombinase
MHYTWASALAELERDLIEERVRAGIAGAKKRNANFGRPRLLTRDSLATARAALDNDQSIGSVAKSLGCSRNTLKRALRRQDALDYLREQRRGASR